MKKYLLFLFLSSLSMANLLPFNINYYVRMEGTLSFNGDAFSILNYQKDTDDWLFDFHAKTKIASIRNTSLFQYKNDQIISKEYSYNRKMLFNNKSFKILFKNNEAIVNEKGHQVPSSVLDFLNSQLALELDLLKGENSNEYDVLYENSLTKESFRILGREKLKTPVGYLNAIKVKKITSNKKRQVFLWFAEDYNYLLIFFDQKDPNGDKYQFFIKNGILNGKQIQGE